jgi:short-subunit dehydrogenase involved in D-alanine esterification of teichoic acids
MRLEGRRVLVTGATGGIGTALAHRLREAGAVPVLTGRDPARLAALEAEGFTVVPGELRTAEGCARLVRDVLAAGPLDVVLHNAGVQHLMDFRAGAPLGAIEEELDVNLHAPLRLTTLLLPHLLSRPEAAVVNVTTGLALVPKQSAPVYCATKAALHSFSQSLRWQLEGTRVSVVEVLPPLVDTPMTAGRGRGKMSPQACADAVVRGLQRGSPRVLVGKSRLLAVLVRVAPSLATRVMRRM